MIEKRADQGSLATAERHLREDFDSARATRRATIRISPEDAAVIGDVQTAVFSGDAESLGKVLARDFIKSAMTEVNGLRAAASGDISSIPQE